MLLHLECHSRNAKFLFSALLPLRASTDTYTHILKVCGADMQVQRRKDSLRAMLESDDTWQVGCYIHLFLRLSCSVVFC